MLAFNLKPYLLPNPPHRMHKEESSTISNADKHQDRSFEHEGQDEHFMNIRFDS